ncbi:hypothetical protein HII17_02740 [Thalassotalea sp. M1531]|uniref:SPOR domain-containing protein n=1 Tax=Thalassotalea algicola TaxID=2716224 RepID=A0A7Y0Q4X9_9GAMM|nr:hypothetical protein [Thalassotalea algicola]NMP30469.1 hypothetical protein [Thalassotalea algicola]
MAALATNLNNTTEKKVMSISTNARIDYILKFSRHTVVVLDEKKQGFGSIAGTFLSSLTDQTNAALIGVSSKLNDIQVRARINEQLFPNQTFDPEISLTQSVIEHYVNSKEPIAIVIEQAHHLSLQIVHELTLLSEIAKKSGRDISVVLLAEMSLGKLIADNHSLFHKKLSMISVENGQLLSSHSDAFKASSPFLALTPFNKMVLSLLTLLVITFIGLYILYQQDSFQFSQLDEKANKLNGVTQTQSIIKPKPTELISTSVNDGDVASVSDVLAALTGKPIENAVVELALPQDILNAINLDKEPKDADLSTSLAISSSETVDLRNDGETKSQKADENIPTTAQYANVNHYVIQFSALALSEIDDADAIVTNFARQFLLSSHQHYIRTINGKLFVVITSQEFVDKPSAVAAMSDLDPELQSNGIWIKSVQTIKKEIALMGKDN